MVMNSEDAISMLDAMDVDEAVRPTLFDTLDCDGTGTLSIEEVIHGLLAVRGEPRRSDAVATMLTVKCMQQNVKTTFAMLSNNQHFLEESLSELDRRLQRFEARLLELAAAMAPPEMLGETVV